MQKTILELFELTQSGKPFGGWKTAGDETDYGILETDDTLYLVFQGSSEGIDWKYNFDFAVKPYQRQPIVWRTHRGFAKAWKLAEDQITSEVKSKLGAKKLVITGYSHGASLSVLAHEYFKFNEVNPETHAFAPARVLWLPCKDIGSRFEKLTVYATRGDIVAHSPFWWWGYRHVGTMKRIGPRRIITHLPHYPSVYRRALS